MFIIYLLGHAPSQFNLGVLYTNGEGVGLDYGQALALYQKAADQGYVKEWHEEV